MNLKKTLRRKVTKALLSRLYITEKRSLAGVAAELGVSRSWAMKLLIRNGIKLRSKKRAAALAVAEGRPPGPK